MSLVKLSRKQSKPSSAQISKSDATKKVEKKTRKILPSSVSKFLKKLFKPVVWLGSKIVPKYFKHSFKELRLVTWTKRKESRRLTTAVVLFSVVLSLVVAVIDLGLDKVFKKVILKQ
ncbi:MAG: preprotein translocase subunit SecE [Candidatus Saccharibacteria bacterium]